MDNATENDWAESHPDLLQWMAGRIEARYPGVKPFSMFLAEQDEADSE